MQYELRRSDRVMDEAETWQLLERGFVGALGTADEDGWPYVVPLSYVLYNGAVYFHKSTRPGHLRHNLEFDSRVCFEVDEPGPVFPSGEKSPCQTSVGFRSLILFGRCTPVADRDEKLAAFRALMAKYADPSWERPDVWPDMDLTAVYRIDIERITGKRRPVTVTPRWRHQFPEAGE